MKALVTGATGLIGSNVVRALLEDGHAVRALVRHGRTSASLAGLPIEAIEGDVLRPKSLVRAARDCDVVFHAAARFTYGGNADELEELAVSGTANMLKAAHKAGSLRVVLTSSSVVFGYSLASSVRDETSQLTSVEGESAYVQAKLLQHTRALAMAKELGLSLVVACPTMSVGPPSAILGPSNAIVIAYLSDPWRMTYPGGCNIVSARDVGRGHVLVADRGISGECYVLGGQNLEWNAIHGLISELCGVSGPLIHASHLACLLAAAAEEVRAKLTGRPALVTRDQAKMVGRYYWYSNKKARALGFRPRTARHALAEAIAWLAASPHVSREIRAQMLLSSKVHAARISSAKLEARLTAA